MAIKTAILVVSDTCFEDSAHDQTQDAVRKSQLASLLTTDTHYVPDVENEIEGAMREFLSKDYQLILTAGGTGFTKKDVTPEAITPLLEKQAPGLVHLMLLKSLEVTPFAACSRPVAGVAKGKLIITLPGSPKAIVECLDALSGVLEHVVEQLDKESSRDIHKVVGKVVLPGKIHHHTHGQHHSHGHYHSHSHHGGLGHPSIKRHLLSNDLSQPLTARSRESPYPMVSVDQALELIREFTSEPTVVTKSILDSTITGHVLAQDCYATADVPAFNASILDGYAVVHTDCPGTYKVVSVSHARPGEKTQLNPGEICRVTTGAPIPLGATAVIGVEETLLISTKDEGKEEDTVQILSIDVEEGDNIRKHGSDISKGSLALKKGTRISPVGGEVGLLASIGVMNIQVFEKPKIALFSTGDELVDLKSAITEEGLKYGQIYDTNQPVLKQFYEGWGYSVAEFGIIRDTAKDLARTIDTILCDSETKYDYLITTGGVSMGETDLIKPVLERELNATIHFGRVAMKPGKPTTFATLEREGTRTVVFALPGNPASASVVSHLFVLPSLRKFAGYNIETPSKLPALSQLDVVIPEDIKLDPRPEYQRVHIIQEGSDMVAYSTGFQRSSRIGSVAGSNGLLVLPSSRDIPGGKLLKGTKVKAMVIDVL